MSNYSQTTFFTPKDSLPTTNPAKTIFGAAYDVEFGNIAAAIATKYDSAQIATSPVAFNLGTASLPGITFVGHTGTGLYSDASSDLGLSAGGISAVVISGSTQTVTFSNPIIVNGTGTSTFNNVFVQAPSSGVALQISSSVANQYTAAVQGPSTAGQSQGLLIQAGTNASDVALQINSASASFNSVKVFGDGSTVLGGTGTTGGAKGYGTLNAAGIYVNGTAVLTSVAVPSGANPSSSVGLTVQNGAATTFMRSDAAPALNQAISPTWTGSHTFSAATQFPATIQTNTNTGGLAITTSSAPNIGIQINSATAGATPTWNIMSAGTGSAFPAGSLTFGVGTTAALSILSSGAIANTATAANNFNNIILQGDGSNGFLRTSTGTLYLGTGSSNWWGISPGGGLSNAAPSSGQALNVYGAAGSYTTQIQGSTTSGQSYGLLVQAGTTSSDTVIELNNASGSQLWYMTGTGGLTAAGATGGQQGAGTVNAQGLYVNGHPVYSGIPVNAQSSNYTAVLSDANSCIKSTAGSPTVTIPANGSVAYPLGTAITFANRTSGGTVTIAINSDTLVWSQTNGTGSRSLANNGVATAIKTDTTLWLITGTGLS